MSSNSENVKMLAEERNEYLCHICEKLFTTAPNLRQHINVHTKEKVYHCIQCDCSFGRASSLKRHMLQHSEEKPFTSNQSEFVSCFQCCYTGLHKLWTVLLS